MGRRSFGWLACIAFSTLNFGCAQAVFTTPTPSGDKGASSTGSGSSDGENSNQTIRQPANQSQDTVNAGGVPAGSAGTGDTPAALLPKVEFIGPPCQRLSDCKVTFRLDKKYLSKVEFDWRTDDSLWQLTDGYPVWGKPDLPGVPLPHQYVSTSGHIVFDPGVQELTVVVRNINQDDTLEIRIGVVMSKCTYNSLLEACSKFFN